jgi:hypothetical protein
MTNTDWEVPGVDIAVAALRTQEEELLRRLGIVREALRALGALCAPSAEARPVTEERSRPAAAVTHRLSQVREVLRESGVPLTAKQIGEALHAKHPSILWRAPGPSLRSVMHGQPEGPDEIVRARPGLFTLASMLPGRGTQIVAPPEEAAARDEAVAVRPRGRLHGAFVSVLASAGGPLHYLEVHRRMCDIAPEVRDWKAVSESLRQLAQRSRGAIVKAGPGIWDLARRTEQPEGAHEAE